ncbi:MAG: MauE/DoxX family redox-associated membrane protein [Actinomycetota bacterium]
MRPRFVRGEKAERWLLWLALGARLVLAGVLVVAGALKVPDPAESVRAVRAYEVLPELIVPLVGYALPPLEIMIALLLFAGYVTRIAAVATAVLMTAFVVGITQAGIRGLTIDCGCFGGGGQVAAGETQYTTELIRDGALLGLAIFLAWHPMSRFSCDRWLNPDRTKPKPNASDPQRTWP